MSVRQTAPLVAIDALELGLSYFSHTLKSQSVPSPVQGQLGSTASVCFTTLQLRSSNRPLGLLSDDIDGQKPIGVFRAVHTNTTTTKVVSIPSYRNW